MVKSVFGERSIRLGCAEFSLRLRLRDVRQLLARFLRCSETVDVDRTNMYLFRLNSRRSSSPVYEMPSSRAETRSQPPLCYSRKKHSAPVNPAGNLTQLVSFEYGWSAPRWQ